MYRQSPPYTKETSNLTIATAAMVAEAEQIVTRLKELREQIAVNVHVLREHGITCKDIRDATGISSISNVIKISERGENIKSLRDLHSK